MQCPRPMSAISSRDHNHISLTNSETNDKQAPCCLQPVPACTSRICRKTCVNISPKKPCVAVRLSYFPASNTFCSGKVILLLLPCSKCAWGSWFFFLSLHFHDLYKYFCCCIVFYFYPLHFIGTKLLVHLQCSHAYLPIYSVIIYWKLSHAQLLSHFLLF